MFLEYLSPPPLIFLNKEVVRNLRIDIIDDTIVYNLDDSKMTAKVQHLPWYDMKRL